MAQNKCIIWAFEISGRRSYESIYTALLPCLSWLENSVVLEHLPAVRHTDWTIIVLSFMKQRY